MVKFSNWENQYVSLVRTIPHFLISEEDGLTAQQQEQLESALCGASSISLDLGCGSGAHLIELARLRPAVLHIGVELRYKRAFRAAQKAQQLGLNNVLIYRGPAQNFMQASASRCFDSAYVNFPDPWSKRRWLKHRMLTAQFLKVLAQRLTPDGSFYYKTDHAEYFADTLRTIRQSGLFRIVRLSRNLHAEHGDFPNIESEFEKLFKYKQMPVHYLEAKTLHGITELDV